MSHAQHPRPSRTARRLAAIAGLAALLLAVALVIAFAGAFAVSRCGDGGEARIGTLVRAA